MGPVRRHAPDEGFGIDRSGDTWAGRCGPPTGQYLRCLCLADLSAAHAVPEVEQARVFLPLGATGAERLRDVWPAKPCKEYRSLMMEKDEISNLVQHWLEREPRCGAEGSIIPSRAVELVRRS